MRTGSGAEIAVPPAAPLAGVPVGLGGRGCASDYARTLLASLGAQVSKGRPGGPDAHPAIAWCRSGLMALTGARDGTPQMCPAPLAACADGVTAALQSLARESLAAPVAGSQWLGARAAILGLQRNGATSPGGSCRLLPAADGRVAVNLPRADDWRSVPAWLEIDGEADWARIERIVAGTARATLIERARLLGLAVAPASLPQGAAGPWYRIAATGSLRPDCARAARRPGPLVVDLSSLWAGPLCGQLLHQLGARVVKVESGQRPDGTRAGPAAFFDLLNAGKASVWLDLATADGIDRLRRLIHRADIVIEASRPRALRQMGLIAEDIVGERPGLTWISITGYGRDEPEAGWVGFGDDAGVAAGLSALMLEASGEPLICGDAIGDPLTGLHAALAAWSSHLGGGGRLIALSLAGVLEHCIGYALPASTEALHERTRRWNRLAVQSGAATLGPPRLRPEAPARPAGADTAAVLAELGIRC